MFMTSFVEYFLVKYPVEEIFRYKKFKILLFTNWIFMFLFTAWVLPLHLNAIDSKPFLVIGDILLITGCMLSVFLLRVGKAILAGSITTFSLFLGPFVHNVIGDYLSVESLSSQRLFETLIAVCFMLPIVSGFASKRRQIIIGMILANLFIIAHIFVLVNRQTNGIEWTYSAYLVVGIVAGLMGLFNLNIVDEAIQTLVKATIDAREANQILEDTVKIRTIELAEANATLLNANQHLEAISMTDGLTGIANRRLFDKTLQSELNRCLRSQSNLSLMLIDLDHFKQYNDTFGHHAGDTCLKQVASALQSCIRRSGELVARYGGEEFGVIIPELSLETVSALAEKLLQVIRDLKIENPSSLRNTYLTISIGVCHIQSLCPIDPRVMTISRFIELADQQLYCAKESGRDCSKFFSFEAEV